MIEKVADEIGTTTPQQMELTGVAVGNAKNSLVRRAGRSLFMAAFGRQPRLPVELLSDETAAIQLHNLSQSEALWQADQCRLEAIKAFADFEAIQQPRRSILRQTPLAQ